MCKTTSRALAAATLLLTAPAAAQDVTLPDRMTWTNYPSQSLMYAQSIAIGEVLENHYGMRLQVMPIRNGFARTLPLIQGQADLMWTGTDGYMAQEGAFIFAKEGYGPQPLRLVILNEITPGNGVAVAADAGIESPADMAGRRVTWVQGSAAPNKIVEATLAFGGLTWDDVVKVPVSSFADGNEAVINNQADVTQANMIAATVERIANSPRGLFWPPTPHDDEAGWERLKSVAPYIQQQEICKGIGVPQGECVEINGYGYPEWLVMADYDADVVYNLLKAMDVHHEEIVAKAPQADGYALDKQNIMNSWPWHEGAVRYLEEKGLWSEEAQAHQDELVRRQEVLAEAWTSFTAGDTPSGETEFAMAWGEARAAALREADLPVVYETVVQE